MPEGDTVYTLARTLGPRLTGQRLDAVRLQRRDLPQLCGRRVLGVASLGKHLFIDLDDGHRLRSHLGLYGSWHGYGRDEPWQKPPGQASLVLQFAERVYVCFNAREVELMRSQGLRSLDLSRHLGPDLIREHLFREHLFREHRDPDQLWDRAWKLLPGDTPVVDLLLDQRVAAGIGNVYKSEVLFLARRSPFLRLRDLQHSDITQLYNIAARLLNQNLQGGPRRTRPADDRQGRLWVYGRAEHPCLTCGTPIRRAALGRAPRSTYWCPDCQGGLLEQVPERLGE